MGINGLEDFMKKLDEATALTYGMNQDKHNFYAWWEEGLFLSRHRMLWSYLSF